MEALDERNQPLGLGAQRLAGGGRGFEQCGARQRLAHDPLLGQELLLVALEGGGAPLGSGQPFGDRPGARAIALRAERERFGGGGEPALVEGACAAGAAQDARDGHPRPQAEPAPDRGDGALEPARLLDRAREPPALARDLGHERMEAVFVEMAGHHGERRGELVVVAAPRMGQHLVARRLHELGGAALVHHLEMRREPRLERKAPQYRLAEGVDGLDLEPAGRVDHAGEEPPGALQQIALRRHAGEPGQVGGEPRVRHRRPVAEAECDAVRHLRRRRLGEGEAQDAGRRRAGEQEAQHAAGEHGRLAGAGRGRDPDRRLGRRRLMLGAAGLGLLRERAHPSPSPPSADHSLTRARWM